MHNNTNGDWSYLKGTISGNLKTELTLFASDRKYLYLGGIYGYGSVSIDKILCGDGIVQYDISGITLDTVTSLPETYQTGTIYGAGATLTWDSNGLKLLDSMGDVLITITNATIGSQLNLSDKVDKVSSTDNAVVRFDGTGGVIQNSGVTINDSNHITAAKFITSGGTSSQFVKGDGSLDSNIYATTASVSSSLSSKVDKISSTDNAVVRFDGTNGDVQNSGVLISDDNNLLTPGNITAGGNNVYIGSTSGSQCHMQYDDTNKCLKFIFD
jgi:hypothetical protein